MATFAVESEKNDRFRDENVKSIEILSILAPTEEQVEVQALQEALEAKDLELNALRDDLADAYAKLKELLNVFQGIVP